MPVPDTESGEVHVGYSNIGEEWIAELFGDDGKELAHGKAQTRADALRELAETTDIMFLACPATDETYHMVDRDILRALGPEGFLINVARGSIVDTPQGNNGFGYDPHFFLRDLGRTAAELDSGQKNLLSHRGKALSLLLEKLKQKPL